MKSTLRYALAGLLASIAVVAVVSPWLDGPGRTGLLAAAALAWTVQVTAFGALVHFRESTKGFLTAWVGGMLVRMTLILLAAWAVTRFPELPPAPTLLGLAGILFGLLLLEPFFFGTESSSEPDGATHTTDEVGMHTLTMDTA